MRYYSACTEEELILIKDEFPTQAPLLRGDLEEQFDRPEVK
jgi:hypothetical protein